MMNNPISAENFSQVYASLETLDVTQIVSTMMKIVPLKEEILRRIKPARRKRRTKVEMQSDCVLPPFSHNSEQIDTDNYNLTSITREPLRKKPRKSKPAKLNRSRLWSAQRQSVEDVQVGRCESDRVDSAASTAFTGSVSPVSSTGAYSETFRNPTIQNPFLNNTLASYQSGASTLPVAFPPYWNVLRMAANEYLYNYSRMAQFSQLPTETVTYANTFNNRSYVDEQASPSSVQQQEEEEEETIDIVDETENADAVDAPRDMSDSAESKPANELHMRMGRSFNDVSSPLTDINCPDCGLTVLLSSLTQHMQRNCSGKLGITARQELADQSGEIVDMNSWQSCTFCSESVPRKHMAKHVRQQHSNINNSFKCNICSETFRNKSTLKRHKITHSLGGGHACSYCAKIFAKPELLRRHELLHTELKRTLWPCTKCKKSFSNKYNLAVHDRMHTGELPFPCPECPERFRVKCSMQNHLKSRHGKTWSPVCTSSEETTGIIETTTDMAA